MDSDGENQTDSNRDDQSNSISDPEREFDEESQGDSDRDENAFFMRSTISRDDTQSETLKEQSMLTELNNKLDSGRFVLNSQQHVQHAGQGADPRLMHSGFAEGHRPQPADPYSSPHPWATPSYVPHFPQRSPAVRGGHRLKADKNAKWRQRMMEERQVSIDSAPGGATDQGERDPCSRSKNMPDSDSSRLEEKHSLSRVSERQLDSRLWATLRDPTSAAELASDNGGKINAQDHMGRHRAKSLPCVVTGSQVAELSMITDSGKLARDAEAGSCKLASISETSGPDVANESPISPRFRLAESLSLVSKKHLGIDMLNQSAEAARFGGYLLDTIDMLENQISYLRAGNNNDDSASSNDSEDDEEVQPPRSQALHRIYCSDERHDHDNILYEDKPTINNDNHIGKKFLNGKVSVQNVTRYLRQHPSICFVIFKEYHCVPTAKGKSRRHPDQHASQRLERLRIVSPSLQKALGEVAEFSPYGKGRGDSSVNEHEMDAPYDFLFHHRKQLKVLEEQSNVYGSVLAPLLGFLDQHYESEYQSAEELFQRGRVTALHLGKLFKPNQMVIAKSEDSRPLEAYVLSHDISIKGEKICFRGWSWQYTGTMLQRKSWHGFMDLVPDEETAIMKIPIYPAEWAPERVVEKLRARGEKFWGMRERHFSTYTGHGWNQDHFYYDDRFMIDMSTYQKMHNSYFSSEERQKFDKWPDTIHRQETLPKESIMLLPPMTYGFNLREKRWVSLDVEKIEPTKWNKNAFERLVLDPKTKELIYALVDVQTSQDNKMGDIVTGKGNGLIILLHGSPGTGKTLTAESVAEIAEKPLYRVTCGDIGTEAQEVEKYLETVLHLGKIWDCVLLLDEADVFLEERTMADLQRNSLVSVFLRILEYYEGILILTSNRVGTFDEAFKSRIQVAIHYEMLTKKSRKQIWQNFFDMLEETEEDVNMAELERRLDELAAEQMNGRQIRNALLTARQLAKHRQERLDWQHLSQVLKTSAAFNKYLKGIKGSDDEWAKSEGLRA